MRALLAENGVDQLLLQDWLLRARRTRREDLKFYSRIWGREAGSAASGTAEAIIVPVGSTHLARANGALCGARLDGIHLLHGHGHLHKAEKVRAKRGEFCRTARELW